jgi:ANTAR domain
MRRRLLFSGNAQFGHCVDMDDEERGMQEQIDALRERMKSTRGETDANRADINRLHNTVQVDRSDIDRLQVGAEVDRVLIAELQTEGVLRAEHAADMEAALRSARVIGAAMGVLMGSTRCTEEQAIQILKKVSNETNVKLREVADAVVLTGGLPEA